MVPSNTKIGAKVSDSVRLESIIFRFPAERGPSTPPSFLSLPKKKKKSVREMAFVMGIRLASYAVAGAALIITHETTKATKEKLWQWVTDKFTSRSSDPASQPPNPCDAGRMAVNKGGDFVNGGTPADIQEPILTENVVTADPMVEGDNAVNGERPAHLEEPTLTAVNVTENAVDRDPTVERSQPNQDKAINVPVSGEFPSHLQAESNAVNGDLTVEPLQRHGVNPTRDAPALVVAEAVSLEATSVHRTVDDVDNAVRVDEERTMDNSRQMDLDELAQYAPDPAPPPGQGIRASFMAAAINAVKDCLRSLFNWLTAIKGYELDPKSDRMRRILVKVGFLVMESVMLEHQFRHHKDWRKIYNIVKNEFWNAWCW